MRMRLLILHQLILIQILLLVPSPALLAQEDEDDVDEQEYNGGDADDTYTLSQESDEEVLVLPTKSMQKQEAKELKRKKFLEVLSYFSNLLTDGKYKEFQMPGEVSNHEGKTSDIPWK